MDEIKRLCMLLYGYSGVGKTPLSNTAPGPRLVIDIENGAEWIQKHVVKWDGKSDPRLLEGLTSDTTVIVNITQTNFAIIKSTILPWLTSGLHPFKSVILDSLSELQEKMMKSIAGDEKRSWDDWDKLLIWCQNLLLELKDLKYVETNPVDTVIIICAADETKAGRIVPMLDGKIAKKVTFKMDVVSYLFREPDLATGGEIPRLRIQPTQVFDSKDRTMILAPHYGSVIDNPDMMDIMRVLNTQPEAVNVTAD